MATTSSSARHRPMNGETGASMLEFAIATPVLMLVVFGILDIVQCLHMKQMLDEAVSRAAVAAATMPNLDIDPNGKNADGYEFKRLMMARRKSNDAGERFLRNIGTIGLPDGPPGSGGNALELVYTEDRQAGEPVEIRSAVMVLLPGDCATVEETGEQICYREGMGFPIGEPRPHGPSRRLLESHGFKVVAMARTTGYLPVVGSRLISSTYLCPRQPIPQTPFAADEDPLLSTGQFPTPYPTPGEPLPVPPKVTPTPLDCVVSAAKCLQRSVERGKFACPRNVVDPADGKCQCTLKRSECFK